MTSVFAVVPIREFENTKLRLAPSLSSQGRAALSSALLTRVLSSLQASKVDQIILVASRPESVLSISKAFEKVRILKESNHHAGVNAAMTDGIRAIPRIGNKLVLLLPSDLPFLTPNALNHAIELTQKFELVIAPSERLDGTSLLAFQRKGAIALHYDDNSFRKHVKEAKTRKIRHYVLKMEEFSLDLDTRRDLASTMKIYDISDFRELVKRIGENKHPPRLDFEISNCSVITSSDKCMPVDLKISNGKIKSIRPHSHRSRTARSPFNYDAKRKIILPGLIDCHCHLFSLGSLDNEVKLFSVKSIAEMKTAIVDFARKRQLGKKEWIFGRGWDQDLFKERRMPSRNDLDETPLDNPIVLVRICGHIAVLNSNAIRQFLKLGALVNPDKLTIPRECNGSLSGIVKESALAECWKVLPRPPVEELKRDFLIAQERALSYGLTGVHCILSENWKQEIQALRLIDNDGSLALNTILFLPVEALAFIVNMDSNRRSTFLNGDKFSIAGFKLYADGSLGARTAALRSDYSDDFGNCGILNYADSDIVNTAERVKLLHLILACHAIGDKAVEQVIRSYSLAGITRGDRFRIEHCSVLGHDLISKLRLAIVSIQPMFATSDYWISKRLGRNRMERVAYPLKTLWRATTLIGGSDAPVESISPLKGIGAARRNHVDLHESLSLFQSISLYSKNAASLSRLTMNAGTIEKCITSDFGVLDCKKP